jgi:hypothetical protein
MCPVRNREREETIFEIFQAKYGLSGDFVHGDCPDFTGAHNGSTLGVELTEIHDPAKVEGRTPIEHEAAKDRVVRRACEEAIRFGLPPLYVRVTFIGTVPDDKEMHLTEALFEVVKNKCPEPEGTIDLDIDEGDEVPDGLWGISILRLRGQKQHHWSWEEAGDVSTDFSDELQKRITEKSARIASYLKRCDKCWLIIAALGTRPSSFYEFDEEMEASSYRSPFDKVFFFEVFTGTVRELRVDNATPPFGSEGLPQSSG